MATIVEDTTDVGKVRNMLTQAGRFVTNVRQNDLFPIFSGLSGSTVYTDYQDIVDIAGIWLPDDVTNSGTNYLSGATIYPSQGKVVISQALPVGTAEVLVTYAASEGLSDAQISIQVDMAKNFMIAEMFADTINFSGTSTFEVLCNYTMLTIASYWSLLALNNSNAIQSGFNYRLGDFEIQTKLWGEGMIAETLLNKFWERATTMLRALKLYQAKPNVPVYVIDRTNTRMPYNKDPNIFNDANLQISHQPIYDSVHRWGIIIQRWG